MNPIPLSSPSGEVYAYACAVCRHVGGGSELIYIPDGDGPIETLVESSLRDAATCCSCRTCGAPEPRGWHSKCEPCAWWRTFGWVFYRIGCGVEDRACAVCHGQFTREYCSRPACIGCGDGHGGDDGRCRDCSLDALHERIGAG